MCFHFTPVAGSEPLSDGSSAADEGYGSTPRRSANNKLPAAGVSSISNDAVVDTEPGENSRKTLDFDHIPTSEVRDS